MIFLITENLLLIEIYTYSAIKVIKNLNNFLLLMCKKLKNGT